jgi:hypothetical protein
MGRSNMVLRSVGVLSMGKILGILHAFIGLLAGLFFALISALGVAIPQQNAAGGGNPMAFMLAGGLIMAVILPVVYGVMGFVSGIIMAALYNFVANIFGGLELHFHNGNERLD